MLRFAAVCCAAAVCIGCQKPDQRAAAGDTTATAPAVAPAAAPAAIALTDVAGKWIVHVTPDTGTTTILTYTLAATDNQSGWTSTFPNRPPVPVRVVAVAGDSIVTEAGPYESALRKGVQVTTHNVSRLQNGKLVGTAEAHYKTSGPDSVRHLKFEATRAP